jgi:hypothetical protein
MSPGYEVRARKALAMCEIFHGEDCTSPEAKKDYDLCHKLLMENGGDYDLALKKFREQKGD